MSGLSLASSPSASCAVAGSLFPEKKGIPAIKTAIDVARPTISVRGQVVAYATVLVLCLSNEVVRWTDADQRGLAFGQWFCGEQADWLPFLPWLLIAPLLWMIRRRPGPMGRC